MTSSEKGRHSREEVHWQISQTGLLITKLVMCANKVNVSFRFHEENYWKSRFNSTRSFKATYQYRSFLRHRGITCQHPSSFQRTSSLWGTHKGASSKLWPHCTKTNNISDFPKFTTYCEVYGVWSHRWPPALCKIWVQISNYFLFI